MNRQNNNFCLIAIPPIKIISGTIQIIENDFTFLETHYHDNSKLVYDIDTYEIISLFDNNFNNDIMNDTIFSNNNHYTTITIPNTLILFYIATGNQDHYIYIIIITLFVAIAGTIQMLYDILNYK